MVQKINSPIGEGWSGEKIIIFVLFCFIVLYLFLKQ